MARRTFVTLTSPLGSHQHKTLSEIEDLISKGRAEWIEPGVSARAISDKNFVDYSTVLTDRCQWRAKSSPRSRRGDPKNFNVMQLL